jgi:hypothetical protein
MPTLARADNEPVAIACVRRRTSVNSILGVFFPMFEKNDICCT